MALKIAILGLVLIATFAGGIWIGYRLRETEAEEAKAKENQLGDGYEEISSD